MCMMIINVIGFEHNGLVKKFWYSVISYLYAGTMHDKLIYMRVYLMEFAYI